MTVVQDHARDVFIAAGLVARDAGILPDALAELAVRLDIKGAGDLLDQLCRLEWTDRVAKNDPKPVPTPKPPKPPADPKPPKGCDCAQCVSSRRRP